MRTFVGPLEVKVDGLKTKTAASATARRFLEFLTAHPNRPLCLAEICATLRVSERTLRSACEEQLGMGPIRYLTLRRMHQVRHALMSADASDTTVTRVAMEYGFAELGRFSVAYRALFCESPSDTLRRSVEPSRNDLI